MSSLARLVSDNSGSLEKLELGHRRSQPSLRKQFPHGVQVLVCGYLRVRFNLLSSINPWYISDFPKLAAHNPYLGSPQNVQSDTIGFYGYDFLLVINCTRGRILHRFWNIAIDMSNVAIFGYPSCVLPTSEGFPWDDLRKILHGGHWMASYKMA